MFKKHSRHRWRDISLGHGKLVHHEGEIRDYIFIKSGVNEFLPGLTINNKVIFEEKISDGWTEYLFVLDLN